MGESDNRSERLRDEAAASLVARILARRGTALESTQGLDHSRDAGELEREARAGTRRVQADRKDREEIS